MSKTEETVLHKKETNEKKKQTTELNTNKQVKMVLPVETHPQIRETLTTVEKNIKQLETHIAILEKQKKQLEVEIQAKEQGLNGYYAQKMLLHVQLGEDPRKQQV